MPAVPSSFVATPDAEAVALLDRLPAVEKQVWAGLLPEVRALAFTISLTQKTDDALKKAEAMRVIERAKLLITSMPAGADQRKVVKQLAADLAPFFPTPAQAQRRAELLVRHWAGMARNAAWYRTLDRQRTAYPFWKYVTFGDDNVRDAHKVLHGLIIPADSIFWDTHFPPWAPMCRCMVVPVSQAEYERIKAAEKHLPEERRTIVDEERLAALEKNNTILTARKFPGPDGSILHGPPTPFPVAPEPGWTGWSPRDLRITYEALSERYAGREGGPEALRKMMDRADRTPIAPGISLGDHIRGLPEGQRLPSIPIPTPTPKSAKPAPAAAPKPALPPVQPATADPAQQVAAKLTLPARGAVAEASRHALDAIAEVHSDGGLQLSPVEGVSQSPAHGGHYRRASTRPRLAANPEDIDTSISINRNDASQSPINALLHEIGHKIDNEAIEFVNPWNGYKAVRSQAAVDVRSQIHSTLANTRRVAECRTKASWSQEHRDYMASPDECFARAYAQYIVTRSTSQPAREELARLRSGSYRELVWEDDDFQPVISLYDQLFAALGWLFL